MSTLEIFASNVSRIVGDRAITITQLAQQIGVTRAYLSNLLNGRIGCRLETAASIADALGTDLGELTSAPKKTKKAVKKSSRGKLTRA